MMRFELAERPDDHALRELYAETPLPGAIRLRYEREPDYFLGCGVYGRDTRTIVARAEGGGLAAACWWSSRPRFVNGREEIIGYLGGLRVAPGQRGQWIIPVGFRSLRELGFDASDARGSLISITDGNRLATGLLADRPRRYAPTLRPIDRLLTIGLIVRKRLLPAPSDSLNIAPLAGAEITEVVSFWRSEGAKRQFFPIYDEQDFAAGSPTTPGFKPGDLLVARRGGRIVGTLGIWDQSCCKQVVVDGYTRTLRAAGPLYNIGARLAGASRLPRPGERLRSAYGAFVCVRNDDPGIFSDLLAAGCREASRRGLAMIVLGFSERDPLLPALRRFPRMTYRSTLYTAAWSDGAWFHDYCDQRIPYVDVATL